MTGVEQRRRKLAWAMQSRDTTHAAALCPLAMSVSPPVMSASHVEDSVVASVEWRDCRRARQAARRTLRCNTKGILGKESRGKRQRPERQNKNMENKEKRR